VRHDAEVARAVADDLRQPGEVLGGLRAGDQQRALRPARFQPLVADTTLKPSSTRGR
jgi:hypothetical protein